MQTQHDGTQNELLRSFFGSLKTKGIIIFDREMRYQLVEGDVLHALGYTPEVMRGKTPFEALPASDAAKLFELYKKALGGESFSIKYYSEPHEKHYKLDFAPLYDDANQISGARLFVEETTTQEAIKTALEERAHEAEHTSAHIANNAHRLRQIVEASPFAIAMFDSKMRYIANSRRWIQAYGLDPARDLTGLLHYDVFPEIGDKWKDDHRRNLAGETLEKEEDPFEREDGSIDYVHWRNVPWVTEDDEVGGVIMFTQVVTERVHNQRELARRSVLLAEKNAELQDAVTKLEQVNSELERFAYVASHDLQEPLRMVTSYTQVLEQRLDEHLGDDTRRYMGYVVEGAARMRTLIDDLLALSRLTTNLVERSEVSMTDVVEQTLRDLRATLDARDGRVTCEELPTGTLAYTHVYQLFLNLLSNAIKFTPSDRPPVIDIGVDVVEGIQTFRVSDQGIGIPAEHRTGVFDAFKRLHNRTEFEGNGIGLSIVKKIVRRYGGRAWLESNPHGGTTVHFTLPDAFVQTTQGPK